MFYEDYTWKKGIPYGKKLSSIDAESSFKIVIDPYRRRISIERYSYGEFKELAYDSALFNFRHLNPDQQMAWEKIPTADPLVCWIRNHEDRIILKEVYQFEQELCRSCKVYYPEGNFLSEHRMFYTLLNDAFNGVILYDRLGHPVMAKKYEFDETLGEFTTLLQEEWDFTHAQDQIFK